MKPKGTNKSIHSGFEKISCSLSIRIYDTLPRIIIYIFKKPMHASSSYNFRHMRKQKIREKIACYPLFLMQEFELVQHFKIDWSQRSLTLRSLFYTVKWLLLISNYINLRYLRIDIVKRFVVEIHRRRNYNSRNSTLIYSLFLGVVIHMTFVLVDQCQIAAS